MTTTTDAVQVRFASSKLVTATVTVDGVAHWVTWTRSSGSWECDACDEIRCCHVLTVMQVTKGQT